MTAWSRGAASLEPVSLAELDAVAALQTRTDRKYVVTPETWVIALASLGAAPRVLEIDGLRSFRYESVYYDTPKLDSYRAAAQRRPRRYKVRTRHYLDTGTCAIEVKLRARTGETVKHREWLSPDAVAEPSAGLPSAARVFVSSFSHTADAVERLRESLTTAYVRTTLLMPDARITVDSDVRGRDAAGAEADFGRALIVETKSVSRAGMVDHALWSLGMRPVKVSKYCTALAALRPELPANRWARTLRRHLAVPDPVTTHPVTHQPAPAG
jgi:hypothetical protein